MRDRRKRLQHHSEGVQPYTAVQAGHFKYARDSEVMDQTKVTSGFDLEVAIGGRYLTNLLLLASDTGDLPAVCPRLSSWHVTQILQITRLACARPSGA